MTLNIENSLPLSHETSQASAQTFDDDVIVTRDEPEILSDASEIPSEDNMMHVESPVVDDAESPVVDDAESPVIDDAESPVVDDAESPVVDDAESPVVDDAESPVIDDNPCIPAVKNPVLDEDMIQTQLRQRGMARHILMIVSIGIFLSVCVALLCMDLTTVQSVHMCVGGLALSLGSLMLRETSWLSPTMIYKPVFVLPFLQKRLRATHYEWKNTHLAKADIQDAKIAENKWMNAFASDRFCANYRGCAFEFYDLKLTGLLKRSVASPVFMGQLFILPLRQSIICPIRMIEYSQKEEANSLRNLSLIKTECPDFDNRFSVDVLVDEQSDDSPSKLDAHQAMEYARSILTPKLARAFVDADDRADSRTRMYFTGNKLYLTHENTFDPFEYHDSRDRNLSIDDLKTRIKTEIIRIEKILDALIDNTDGLLQIEDNELDLADVGYLEDVWNALQMQETLEA